MKAPTLVQVHPLMTALRAEPLTDKLPETLTGCYISDLLSDVLVVLFTCGRKPCAEIIAEAEEDGVALLTTPLTTYEAAGKLWEAGLRGETAHE
jgi:hypothetical protein